MIYPKSIASLIEHFQKFPSVGPKSAQRMAFYLLRMPKSEVEKFAQSMIEAKENTKTCEICFNLSSTSPCEICNMLLGIKELLNRLTDEKVKEVILALSPSVEGEATSLYLNKLIKPFGVKISRIAFGLPVGADLEYADEITIAKAIEGRREL